MGRGGAKPKYRKRYAEMAEIACAEGGFTDVKLAKLFGVSKTTINNWKRDHPEFLVSVKRGKEKFDTENVEASLLKRALGYEYQEVTKEFIPGEDKEVITKKVKKHIPGDVKGQIFWLRNRDRSRWPDTQKLNGQFNINMTHEEMLDQLDEE